MGNKSMVIGVILVILVWAFFPAGPISAWAGLSDTMRYLIEEKEKQDAGAAVEGERSNEGERLKEKPSLPCPENRECRLVDIFVKENYEPEVRKYPLARLTKDRAFTKIALYQHIGGEHGLIVNSVKVRKAGRWTDYDQGRRLPEGRTILNLPVPRAAEELLFSIDHGRGAVIAVVLEGERREMHGR